MPAGEASQRQLEVMRDAEQLLVGEVNSVFEDFIEYCLTTRPDDAYAIAKAFFEAYASKSKYDHFANEAEIGPEIGPTGAEVMAQLDPLLRQLAKATYSQSKEKRDAKGWSVALFCSNECLRMEESGELESLKKASLNVEPLPLPVTP